MKIPEILYLLNVNELRIENKFFISLKDRCRNKLEDTWALYNDQPFNFRFC